jgi:hypothetical protein
MRCSIISPMVFMLRFGIRIKIYHLCLLPRRRPPFSKSTLITILPALLSLFSTVACSRDVRAWHIHLCALRTPIRAHRLHVSTRRSTIRALGPHFRADINAFALEDSHETTAACAQGTISLRPFAVHNVQNPCT